MPSGRREWIATAKAIYGRFGEVQVTDRAAALTYYSILSLFPALIVVVSLLALLGSYPETYESIVDTLRDAAPGTAVDTIDSALRGALSNRGNAGVLLVVGLVLAFYSASGAMGAAMRALEAINRAPRGPRFPAEPRRPPRADRARHAAGAGRLPGGGGRRAAVRLDRRRGRVSRRRQGPGRLPALADRRGGAAGRLRARLRARAAADTKRGDRSLRSVLPGAAVGTGALVRRLPRSSPSTSPTSAPTTRPMAPSAP